MKPTNNLLFVASRFGHRVNNCLLESASENCGKPSHNHSCGDTSNCVNCQGNHKFSSNTCPTFITLSKNIAFYKNNENSSNSSHNQLKFFQEHNFYQELYIIALQETNVKDKLDKIFKNWKRKFHWTFTEKKLGFGAATLIKNDIKNVFVNNIQSKFQAIWNLVEMNGKQTLMDNVYIPPGDSEMLYNLTLS